MGLILEMLIELFGEFFLAVLLKATPGRLRKAALAALFAVVMLTVWWALRS